MTNNNHPITPPSQLVTEWWNECTATSDNLIGQLATQAARWGSDQELDACVEWIRQQGYHPCVHKDLRADRRPKPPSLKEMLLVRVARIPGEGADSAFLHHWLENESQRLVDAIHKAIDSLPDEQ